MKAKDRKDLHTKSINELQTMVAEAKQALMTTRLDHSLHKLKNTADLRQKKADIARILSVLTEKMQTEAKEVKNG